MFKRIWLLTMSSPKNNIFCISCAVLVFAFVFSMSSAGEFADYRVGAGDILNISVWGDESLSGVVTVGPDGTIMLQLPIGSVQVNQLTADQIAELLTKKLEEYVKQPVVSVSIRSFQGFVVHVRGQVNVPGFYRIPESTSLQEVITQAGGFTEMADISSIILLRKSDEEIERRTINFTRFLKQSDMEADPILEVDDVIVVPAMAMDEKMSQMVTIVGEVSKPGSYDLEMPMTFLGVLALCGGILNSADKQNIIILNKTVEGKNSYREINMESIFAEASESSVQMLMVSPGETVFVPSMILPEKYAFSVNVVGQAVTPGAYSVTEGMRLMDAIFLAGGFAAEASIDNIALIHEEQDAAAVSLFSLRKYLVEGDLSVNPVLSERDTIVIPMLETARVISPVQMAFSTSITVSIIGAVTNPGIYQVSTKSGLLDILTLAGGQTKDADLKKTMVVRSAESGMKQRLVIDLESVLREGKLELLPVMFSGDIVLIPKERESRDWWRIIMTGIRDISVIVGLIYTFGRISWN